MLNPAARIIGKLGGFAVVAKICDVDVSRVHRWTYEVERGGTGGFIPRKRQDLLLAAAPELNVPLTRADFFDAAPDTARPAHQASSEAAE